MTDPLGQSQVLPYICGLAKSGYAFTLISCEKKHRFENGKSIIEKIAAENNIDWHPLPYTKNPPVVSTMLDVRKVTKKAKQLHRDKKFSLVHCRGHIPGLTGLVLKKKFNVPFLFDMRGFWADEKKDAGAWRLNNPLYAAIYRYFKAKEKSFLLYADHTVCLTHRGADELKTWDYLKSINLPLTVIPCCADIELFNPATVDENRRHEIRKGLGITGSDKIISYLGSIGTWYMLDEMLEFFKVFQQSVPPARLLFITHDEHERIRNAGVNKGIDSRCIIIRPTKRAEVPVVLSLSDYSVFFIRPTYSKISSSPTKQGEIMAMGIPVVCNAGIGDTDLVVNHYHSGVVANSTTDEAYKKAVSSLLNEKFDKVSIRAGADDYFSLEKGVASYNSIYNSLTHSY
jgi:glycosyltransferase involved in cell wall biosynthesis